MAAAADRGGGAAQDCPLCAHGNTAAFAHVQGRDYLRCRRCDLVWLRPDQRPSPDEELAEYRLHDNDPADMRYRRHLARLTDLMAPHLPAAAAGLDFGSGPGPAISVMLGEAGYHVDNYDPFFADDKSLLARRYDFITCTEAAEHFHNPGAVIASLAACLKPGGVLGVMTRLNSPGVDFATWHYIRERSHVSFYAPATMRFIAARHGWRAAITPPDLTLFFAV